MSGRWCMSRLIVLWCRSSYVACSWKAGTGAIRFSTWMPLRAGYTGRQPWGKRAPELHLCWRLELGLCFNVIKLENLIHFIESGTYFIRSNIHLCLRNNLTKPGNDKSGRSHCHDSLKWHPFRLHLDSFPSRIFYRYPLGHDLDVMNQISQAVDCALL